MAWDDAAQTLTIGDRVGAYPGMLENRTFQIVLVGANHGAGGGQTEKADKTVKYIGKKIVVTP